MGERGGWGEGNGGEGNGGGGGGISGFYIPSSELSPCGPNNIYQQSFFVLEIIWKIDGDKRRDRAQPFPFQLNVSK